MSTNTPSAMDPRTRLLLEGPIAPTLLKLGAPMVLVMLAPWATGSGDLLLLILKSTPSGRISTLTLAVLFALTPSSVLLLMLVLFVMVVALPTTGETALMVMSFFNVGAIASTKPMTPALETA